MKTTIILGSILLGPGALLCSLYRTNSSGSLLSIVFSYALFMGLAYGFHYFGLDTLFGPLIVAVGMFCVFALVVLALRRLTKVRSWSINKHGLRDYLLVLVLSGVYATWAGAYLEIPADVWRHLGQIGNYLDQIELGKLNLNQPWYLMYATALSISGESLVESIEPFAIFGTVLWLIVVVDFTKLLCRSITMSDAQRSALCLLSAFLTLTLFGTSSFSFARYYVFAPAYFAFPVFFFGIFIASELVKRGHARGEGANLVGLLLVCFVVTYLVHKQEALFLFAFITTLGSFSIFSFLMGKYGRSGFRSGKSSDADTRIGPWVLLFILAAIGITGIFALNRNGLFQVETVLVNNSLSISSELIGPREWVIADPMGRVFETINLWGIGAIACYFCCVRKRDRYSALSVLIVTPMLFMFNPLFNHFFLRYAEHDVLWRFTYMVPIGLIGAYVLVMSFGSGVGRRVRGWVSVVVLGGLLLPLPGISGLQNLRWSTVGRMDPGNTWVLWHDLIDDLQTRPQRNILTDPVTGYVIRALTNHQVFGFKFHSSTPFIPINYEGYSDESFSGFDTWLFVRNNRDGSSSVNGRTSGHWPQDIMSVSRSYSDLLTEFLDNPPDHFTLLWASDGIQVFEIIDPEG